MEIKFQRPFVGYNQLFGTVFIVYLIEKSLDMKTIKIFPLVFLLGFIFNTGAVLAQSDADTVKKIDNKYYIIEKNDGTKFVGKIISQDMREVIIESTTMGKMAIPKHEIKSIKEAKEGDISADGEYVPSEVFSTRYFLTTNGLPIEKGENYAKWGIFGPDFQFGVGKNFGLGVMTSWVGMPLIGTAKYSISLGSNVHVGLGALFGTGSWIQPDIFIGLPFGAITFGDRRRNISFSGGYGFLAAGGESDGQALFSVGGMFKIGKKISLIFDSMIVPVQINSYAGNFAIFVPGMRWQHESDKAFQFGFGGIMVDGEVAPFPLPMVSWFRKF